MTMTLEDLKESLQHLDEVTLLEVLDITSEELVEMFVDRIEERFDYLENELC